MVSLHGYGTVVAGSSPSGAGKIFPITKNADWTKSIVILKLFEKTTIIFKNVSL